jgi:hypothetical protein
MCSLPAAFLTYVCVSYLLVAPHQNAGLALPQEIGNIAGASVAFILFTFCAFKGWQVRKRKLIMQDTSCG